MERRFCMIPEFGGRVLRVACIETADDSHSDRIFRPKCAEAVMTPTIKYSPEDNAAYIRLSQGKILESAEVAPDVVFDYDAEGRIVGIELLDARAQLSRSFSAKQRSGYLLLRRVSNRAQLAGRLHLIVKRDRIPIVAVRPRDSAILHEQPAKVGGILERLQHRPRFACYEREIALAHRIVGKLDGEAIVAERLCFSHFNQHLYMMFNREARRKHEGRVVGIEILSASEVFGAGRLAESPAWGTPRLDAGQ